METKFNKTKYFTLVIFVLGIALAPSLVFAAPTIQGIVDGAVKIAFQIASGVIAILWVVAGIMFLTARGEAGKINTARTALFTAIAGTILIILANGAMSLVKNAFNLN